MYKLYKIPLYNCYTNAILVGTTLTLT